VRELQQERSLVRPKPQRVRSLFRKGIRLWSAASRRSVKAPLNFFDEAIGHLARFESASEVVRRFAFGNSLLEGVEYHRGFAFQAQVIEHPRSSKYGGGGIHLVKV